MRVILGGAGGMIGSALKPHLEARGHTVVPLARSAAQREGAIAWDPERGLLEPSALRGADAVVHLGGVSIAAGRWTVARKQRIFDSRVRSTLLLAERIAALPAPDRPRTFLVPSASGYYGDRGDEALVETSAPGEGFLPDVCRAWEEAAGPAARAGVRVAHPRFGMVLSRRGGALAAMLLPFRLGLGGSVGSGRQWWPWIALSDVLGVLERLLVDETFSGPINAVAPEPATSAGFARALGRALHRPAIFRVPAFALRALLGEMAEGLLLASAKMIPDRLARAAFPFRYTRIDAALAAELTG